MRVPHGVPSPCVGGLQATCVSPPTSRATAYLSGATARHGPLGGATDLCDPLSMRGDGWLFELRHDGFRSERREPTLAVDTISRPQGTNPSSSGRITTLSCAVGSLRTPTKTAGVVALRFTATCGTFAGMKR